ncbi:hypothetical protein KEM56_003255 [Ascosphaera pollenicola]|nr:hypothetical protein KEM56_003255 [Ascosphaera pollenicola]
MCGPLKNNPCATTLRNDVPTICYVNEPNPYDEHDLATVKSSAIKLSSISLKKAITRIFARPVEEFTLTIDERLMTPDFADLLDLNSLNIRSASLSSPIKKRSKTKRALTAVRHFLEQFIV